MVQGCTNRGTPCRIFLGLLSRADVHQTRSNLCPRYRFERLRGRARAESRNLSKQYLGHQLLFGLSFSHFLLDIRLLYPNLKRILRAFSWAQLLENIWWNNRARAWGNFWLKIPRYILVGSEWRFRGMCDVAVLARSPPSTALEFSFLSRQVRHIPVYVVGRHRWFIGKNTWHEDYSTADEHCQFFSRLKTDAK